MTNMLGHSRTHRHQASQAGRRLAFSLLIVMCFDPRSGRAMTTAAFLSTGSFTTTTTMFSTSKADASIFSTLAFSLASVSTLHRQCPSWRSSVHTKYQPVAMQRLRLLKTDRTSLWSSESTTSSIDGIRSMETPEESSAEITVVGSSDTMIESSVVVVSAEPKRSLWMRIKQYFTPKDGLTNMQRLRKMGLATVLSYGFVSNMSNCFFTAIAWYIFASQRHVSPLAPGQWKPFLAVYAGFYVISNVIRPIRMAAAVAISPSFDAIVLSIQQRLGTSRSVAIFVTVFLVNVLGTCAVMATGVIAASTLAGVPIFVPRVVG